MICKDLILLTVILTYLKNEGLSEHWRESWEQEVKP
jgi:hypothetical protein